MKKPILILIAVGIFVALITSGVCNGPIDEVFNGWRDKTTCEASVWSCFVNVDAYAYGNGQRDIGIIVMAMLLVITVFIYGLVKVFSWLKNR